MNNSQYSIYTTIVDPIPDTNNAQCMTCISVHPFTIVIIKYMNTIIFHPNEITSTRKYSQCV